MALFAIWILAAYLFAETNVVLQTGSFSFMHGLRLLSATSSRGIDGVVQYNNVVIYLDAGITKNEPYTATTIPDFSLPLANMATYFTSLPKKFAAALTTTSSSPSSTGFRDDTGLYQDVNHDNLGKAIVVIVALTLLLLAYKYASTQIQEARFFIVKRATSGVMTMTSHSYGLGTKIASALRRSSTSAVRRTSSLLSSFLALCVGFYAHGIKPVLSFGQTALSSSAKFLANTLAGIFAFCRILVETTAKWVVGSLWPFLKSVDGQWLMSTLQNVKDFCSLLVGFIRGLEEWWRITVYSYQIVMLAWIAWRLSAVAEEMSLLRSCTRQKLWQFADSALAAADKLAFEHCPLIPSRIRDENDAFRVACARGQLLTAQLLEARDQYDLAKAQYEQVSADSPPAAQRRDKRLLSPPAPTTQTDRKDDDDAPGSDDSGNDRGSGGIKAPVPTSSAADSAVPSSASLRRLEQLVMEQRQLQAQVEDLELENQRLRNAPPAPTVPTVIARQPAPLTTIPDDTALTFPSQSRYSNRQSELDRMLATRPSRFDRYRDKSLVRTSASRKRALGMVGGQARTIRDMADRIEVLRRAGVTVVQEKEEAIRGRELLANEAFIGLQNQLVALHSQLGETQQSLAAAVEAKKSAESNLVAQGEVDRLRRHAEGLEITIATQAQQISILDASFKSAKRRLAMAQDDLDDANQQIDRDDVLASELKESRAAHQEDKRRLEALEKGFFSAPASVPGGLPNQQAILDEGAARLAAMRASQGSGSDLSNDDTQMMEAPEEGGERTSEDKLGEGKAGQLRQRLGEEQDRHQRTQRKLEEAQKALRAQRALPGNTGLSLPSPPGAPQTLQQNARQDISTLESRVRGLEAEVAEWKSRTNSRNAIIGTLEAQKSVLANQVLELTEDMEALIEKRDELLEGQHVLRTELGVERHLSGGQLSQIDALTRRLKLLEGEFARQIEDELMGTFDDADDMQADTPSAPAPEALPAALPRPTSGGDSERRPEGPVFKVEIRRPAANSQPGQTGGQSGGGLFGGGRFNGNRDPANASQDQQMTDTKESESGPSESATIAPGMSSTERPRRRATGRRVKKQPDKMSMDDFLDYGHQDTNRAEEMEECEAEAEKAESVASMESAEE